MVEGLLLMGAIIVLNVLFFRGVLAALVPLLAVTLVGGAAVGLIGVGAWLLDLKVDAGTPSLIPAVLIGIGVDYFLFLIFRMREQLRTGAARKPAAAAAARSVGEVIASAALAVIAAFATLALAQFGQFQVLGPAVALSVGGHALGRPDADAGAAGDLRARASSGRRRRGWRRARTASPPGSVSGSPRALAPSRSAASPCSPPARQSR